jgi:hypothetical protein
MGEGQADSLSYMRDFLVAGLIRKDNQRGFHSLRATLFVKRQWATGMDAHSREQSAIRHIPEQMPR